MQKAGWISHGHAICNTLFFVFCSLFIANGVLGIQFSKLNIRLSQLDLQGVERGMPMTSAPQNLESVPESFRLGLRVESRDFPTEEMTQTQAWSGLQNTATAYAQRLELMQSGLQRIDSQNTNLSLWMAGLYFLSAVGMVVFGMWDRQGNQAQTRKEEGR